MGCSVSPRQGKHLPKYFLSRVCRVQQLIWSFAQRNWQVSQECDLLTADTREDSVKTTAAAYAIICDSPTRCLPLNEARPGIVPLMGLPGEVLLPVKRMTS